MLHRILMVFGSTCLISLILFGPMEAACSQNTKQLVGEAVQTELAADAADHSHWMYLDIDRKPGNSVTQWVAETGSGDLHRLMETNGAATSPAQQRQAMDNFVMNRSAQNKQRKGSAHDDKQATEMLKLLPDAFIWTRVSDQNGRTILHFAPDPNFQAPDWESRVFAAMEGEMAVDDAQHRIVSLKGRLIRDVKFAGGLLGELNAGGTFDVERREVGNGVWQITETHVHIDGRALLFKNISEEEDETKSKFTPLPNDISLQQAESKLMQDQK